MHKNLGDDFCSPLFFREVTEFEATNALMPLLEKLKPMAESETIGQLIFGANDFSPSCEPVAITSKKMISRHGFSFLVRLAYSFISGNQTRSKSRSIARSPTTSQA